MKDNSGAYAVFVEQGSSAAQMTAAKVMDVVARLLDCDGQAADAISAYTQVKNVKIPLFFLSETYTDTHSQDSCGKDRSKKHCWNLVG